MRRALLPLILFLVLGLGFALWWFRGTSSRSPDLTTPASSPLPSAPSSDSSAAPSAPALTHSPLSPSLRPGPGNSPPPLAKAIQSDDLCETVRLLEETNFIESPDLAAFLSSVGAPTGLQELFSPAGPLYGPTNPTPDSPAARFFLALRLGGLSEYGAERIDLPRAHSLLRELEAGDPGNAAFPFFRLAVERKQGLSPEALAATAATAARGRHFDTFLPRLLDELEPLRWQSPSHHLALTALVNSLVNLHYGEGSDALTALGPQAPGAAAAVGRLMMEGGAHRRELTEHQWGKQLSGEEVEEEPAEAPEVFSTDCRREEYDRYFQQARGR